MGEETKKRILVTGSSLWTRADLVAEKLLEHGPGVIVTDGYPGAARIAEEFARLQGWPVDSRRPDWREGRAQRRTHQLELVRSVDLCIGFLNPVSEIARGFVQRARDAGVPVDLIEVSDW